MCSEISRLSALRKKMAKLDFQTFWHGLGDSDLGKVPGTDPRRGEAEQKVVDALQARLMLQTLKYDELTPSLTVVLAIFIGRKSPGLEQHLVVKSFVLKHSRDSLIAWQSWSRGPSQVQYRNYLKKQQTQLRAEVTSWEIEAQRNRASHNTCQGE